MAAGARIGVAAFDAGADLEGVAALAVSGDFAEGAGFAGGAGASSGLADFAGFDWSAASASLPDEARAGVDLDEARPVGPLPGRLAESFPDFPSEGEDLEAVSADEGGFAAASSLPDGSLPDGCLESSLPDDNLRELP